MKTNDALSGQANRLFESEYGYFDGAGHAFVIVRPDTPRPWVNVLSNDDYGLIFSQAGSGFSWRGNSQLNKLNRWEQDLVRDNWGRYLYFRRNDTGVFGSVDWLPCKTAFDHFEVRHAPGYSRTRTEAEGLRFEKTVFVPNDAPLEVWRVAVTNLEQQAVEVDLFSFLEWHLGGPGDHHREFHRTFTHTQFDPAIGAVLAWKEPAVPDPGRALETPQVGFVAAIGALVGFEADKEAFLGRYGELREPQAVRAGELTGRQGRYNDPVASLQVRLTLAAGQTATVLFLVGLAFERDEIAPHVERFRQPGEADRALEAVVSAWQEKIGRVRVETPDPAMNLLTNVWLKHQAISGRIWARSGYYQQSGAYGYRDQLQDSHIWLPLEPARTKKQILLHASQQYASGSVRHWWHPGNSFFAVTHHSDTPLWLPFLTLNYLDETADDAILQETAPYLDGGGEGNLLEHCLRAIDFTLGKFSPRGLPLIGGGDWNDGLSHAGLQGKGESVWLGHFLFSILTRMVELPALPPEKAEEYRRRAEAVKRAVNEHGWDGDWYIAGTRDDGKPLGGRECEEGRLFLNAQTWAIIAGTAEGNRGETAMDSAWNTLFREYGPLLLTPAYTHTDPNIGYLSRYSPGMRENGGVYTHAATWAIWALCLMGRGNEAWETYQRLSPPRRQNDIELYSGEPYVTPGNSDGPESPTFGRGSWTWYTGSAAWLYRVALEWICGVRPTREGLLVDPCIPAEWEGFTVRRPFRGADYEITVRNPNGVQRGVVKVTVDGAPIQGTVLPVFADNQLHRVEVELG